MAAAEEGVAMNVAHGPAGEPMPHDASVTSHMPVEGSEAVPPAAGCPTPTATNEADTPQPVVAAVAPVAPAQMQTMSMPNTLEALVAEVGRLKALLDDQATSTDDKLDALEKLRARGSLPTKLLSDTLIGKTVNTLAKADPSEAVKTSARALVDTWRNTHRKRKAGPAGVGGPDDPALKRTLSTASIESEPSFSQTLSQEDKLTSTLSTDSLMAPEVVADTAGEKGASKMTPQREKVRQKLVEAFGKQESIESKDDSSHDQDKLQDPLALANDIEEALFQHFEGKEKDYVLQARTIIFNLKDKKNHNFRLKLLVGFFQPQQVPTLTAEDMASDEKKSERAKMRQFSMEEIQSDWALKKGKIQITGMFTCGKCKATKTTYFQMQTRSSDEPMTTFVTCLNCNNRWKFC
eukprot:TRINITY_DN49182_c0_g1_i1.p1 TRINITY_DN49182_c0_g1~~TRINITY_DN49182_c0_g1_i1.p1  ORF type:complete len:439 (+),score=89.12 TRINITY_DN49182_c0_g1_i1:98-1318(+)